jgi:excisionase family DNA binding protein
MRSLLTVVEAADRLNVGERFIRRLIEERRIEFVRLGRKVRIPADALESIVEQGTVSPARRRVA